MKINGTASYTPSYTANYGDVQSAERKAGTKVTVNPHIADAQAVLNKAMLANLTKSVGTHINAKA